MRYHEIVEAAVVSKTELAAEVERLRIGLESRFPGLDLWVTAYNTTTLRMDRIVLPKDQRGEGTGTKIMTELTDFADQHHMMMALSPSTSFGGTIGRLRTFYRRFGFVPNKGRNKDFSVSDSMIRQPKV